MTYRAIEKVTTNNTIQNFILLRQMYKSKIQGLSTRLILSAIGLTVGFGLAKIVYYLFYKLKNLIAAVRLPELYIYSL